MFDYQPITEDGKEMFLALIMAQDWSEVYTDSPSEAAENLTIILEEITNACFPLVSVVHKSTDKAWITNGLRRQVRRRRRIYEKEGRSERWDEAKEETGTMMERNKVRFFDRMKEKAKNTRNSKAYYMAI